MLADFNFAWPQAEIAVMELRSQKDAINSALQTPDGISHYVEAQQSKGRDFGDHEYDELRSQLNQNLLALSTSKAVQGPNHSHVQVLQRVIDQLEARILDRQKLIVESQLASVASQLTAAVSSSNCATAPSVSWQSSASSVASVSASGLVAALAQGTTTISATTSGRTGSAVITVQGGPVLTVSSIRPAAAATDVAIDSVVRIVFSEPLDVTTVTSTSVTLSQGTTVVDGTRSVSGNTVTLTPLAKLTEFNTSYRVAVTADVKSTGANYLAAPFAATFTTAFWDPAYFYRITNAFMGPTKALDTFSGATNQCFFGDLGNFQGQNWYFVPIPTAAGTMPLYSFGAGGGFGSVAARLVCAGFTRRAIISTARGWVGASRIVSIRLMP